MTMSAQAKHLDDLITRNNGPVLVSFYNDTCAEGVCGAQNRYLGKLANDLQGSDAAFVEVDIDDAPDLVRKYQITTLPTALLFVDGAVHTRLSGLIDPGVLACAVLRHLEDGTRLMARSGHLCPVPQAVA